MSNDDVNQQSLDPRDVRIGALESKLNEALRLLGGLMESPGVQKEIAEAEAKKRAALGDPSPIPDEDGLIGVRLTHGTYVYEGEIETDPATGRKLHGGRRVSEKSYKAGDSFRCIAADARRLAKLKVAVYTDPIAVPQ